MPQGPKSTCHLRKAHAAAMHPLSLIHTLCLTLSLLPLHASAQIETLKMENARLRQAASSGGGQGGRPEPSSLAETTLLFSLEQELSEVRAQVSEG